MRLKDEKERRIVRGDRDLSVPLIRDGLFERDRNIIVRAGAGSGKTSVLVERMVALVRSGISPEKIAAITFTRKAAGELRGRFFEMLHSAASQLQKRQGSSASSRPDFGLEKERVIKALESLESVFIDTIHSFCLRLLRERPFEAGLPPDFHLIDDREEERLRRSYWNAYLTESLITDESLQIRFDRLGIPPGDLFDYFGVRCRFSHLQARGGSHDEPDLIAAVRAVLEFIRSARAYLPKAGARDRFMSCLERSDRFLAVRGIDEPRDQAAFITLFDDLVNEQGILKSGIIQVTKWSRTRSDPAYLFAKSLEGRFEEGGDEDSIASLVMREIRPALVSWRQWIFDPVEAFVFPAVEGYASHRRSIGKQTFDDLLLNTVRLLKRSSDARRFFGRRFERILVDEFQDTDPLQAEILFLLTSIDAEMDDWRRCRPRDGSLFIVGDDKQSIYRFRHADVRVFEECGRLIVERGGVPVRLTSNFRTDARICAWNNQALRGLFEASCAPYQATYENLDAADQKRRHGPSVLQIVTDRVKRHSPSAIARIDAGQIAGVISHLVSGRGISLKHPNPGGATDFISSTRSFGDFMILVRSSNRMHIYAQTLQNAGIPYVEAGGKSIRHTRILPPILDLLDAAYNESDPVPLLAFLRGPFSGISDASLYRYSQAKGSFSGLRGLPDRLTSADRPAFEDAFEMLNRTRRALIEWPFSQALEWILTEFGVLSAAVTREDGSAEAGALFRILSVIRGFEHTGMHWSEAVDELRRIVAGERDVEGMTLEIGSRNAVRLLNVHQAKGLESKVVFLADPLPGSDRHGVEVHVDRSGDETSVVLPVFRRQKYTADLLAEPLAWAEAVDMESRFANAEADRLTYVAATRACSLLLVSRYAGSSDRGTWRSLYPALDSEDVPAVDSVDPVVLTPEIEDLDRMVSTLAGVRDRLSDLGKQSYGRRRVSDASETGSREDDFADEFRGGHGRGYGRAVHRLFEYAVHRRSEAVDRGRDRLVADRLVAEELEDAPGRYAEFVAQAVSALDEFRASDVWSELCSSSTLFTEIPFSILEKSTESPTVVSGVIDLVYRHGGSWKIVDYKTDAVPPVSLVEKYLEQVSAYATHWEKLTGERVAEIGFWSVHENAWQSVAIHEN